MTKAPIEATRIANTKFLPVAGDYSLNGENFQTLEPEAQLIILIEASQNVRAELLPLMSTDALAFGNNPHEKLIERLAAVISQQLDGPSADVLLGLEPAWGRTTLLDPDNTMVLISARTLGRAIDKWDEESLNLEQALDYLRVLKKHDADFRYQSDYGDAVYELLECAQSTISFCERDNLRFSQEQQIAMALVIRHFVAVGGTLPDGFRIDVPLSYRTPPRRVGYTGNENDAKAILQYLADARALQDSWIEPESKLSPIKYLQLVIEDGTAKSILRGEIPEARFLEDFNVINGKFTRKQHAFPLQAALKLT